MNKKQKIILVFIVVIFLAINLNLFDKGASGDIWAQQDWGNKALKSGVSSLYLGRTTDYPPLYLYVLKFNAWTVQSLYNKTDPTSRGYNFISKSFPLLCNLLIGLIIFYYLNKKSYKIGLMGMGFYLFNLALNYNTSYWGQIDSVNALFMFLSIFFLIKKKYTISSICITLAILIKLQSIVVLPVVVMVIFRKCNLKKIVKIILINIITAFLVLIPYIINGAFLDVASIYINSVGSYPWVSVNAYNLWTLFSPTIPNYMDGLRDTIQIFGISLKTIGLSLFAIYTLIVMYQLYKGQDKNKIIFAASSMVLAFFMLPTQIHERYLFPFFALFALIGFDNIKYLWIYITLAITHLMNLMIVFNFNQTPHSLYYQIQLLFNYLGTHITYRTITIVVSVINIVIFVYLSKIGIFNNIFKKKRLQ